MIKHLNNYLSIAFLLILITACRKTSEINFIEVTDVSLDKTTIELIEGEEATLIATVIPDNATNKAIIWETSNSDVVNVSDGKITALKPGSATITVITEDGNHTDACTVKVSGKIIPVIELELDKDAITLVEGEEATLTATVKPDNATNKTVIWESSDTDVATVRDGIITAVKEGEATVTVTTEDRGLTMKCQVTVLAKVITVSEVTLDKASVSLVEGEETTLTATVTPDNATNKKVSWTSSDNNVASVSDGKVTALKPGTATITVTTEDGGKTATCEVTVKAKQSYDQNEQVGEVEGQW